MKIDSEVVQRYANIVNAEVLIGWKSGLQGKQRIAGKYMDRLPPNELNGQRLSDWYIGYDAALRFNLTKLTFFSYRLNNEEKTLKRKGWVARWPVVKMLEKRGVLGDVTVHYMQDGESVKEHCCMVR